MEKGRRMARETKKTKKRMSKEEIEKKKKKIITTFFIILAIIFVTIIVLIVNDYIILGKNKTTNLVINNKNVTGSLKNDILIEDNVIYLSKPDIANFFDKYIYDEKETNQIITTYDKKVAAIGYAESKITINGSEKEIYGHVMEKDGVTYLPISEMADVYDVEIKNIPNTKVVTMDSLDREQKRAIVSSNLAVKSSTNIIAKTVDRIKKGDSVIVISSEKGYSKIRTENGKLGYVKTNKLENEYVVRESMEEELQVQGKVNLTWDYYSNVASAPDRSGTSIDGVNVVSPAFFYIDENGKFRENVGVKGREYIEWAHGNGYKIWPMFANAEAAKKGLSITSNIMNSYEKRQEIIEELVDVCVKYELDGINVDFENMKQEDKDMYSRFIIELTPRLKEMGLVTSVDVTAPDGGETWSMCFDRHVIGDVADYIVFMAYDQYGVSSKKPGTTAGYDWVKLSLNKFLQTEEIDSNKIILAVPFYTRVWTTDESGEITSNTIDMKNIDKFIPDNVEKQWKDDIKQNYVEYSEDGKKKQIWIEDLDSLKAKISLINENKLGGIASWQKGMESDDVWQMIKEELNQKNQT